MSQDVNGPDSPKKKDTQRDKFFFKENYSSRKKDTATWASARKNRTDQGFRKKASKIAATEMTAWNEHSEAQAKKDEIIQKLNIKEEIISESDRRELKKIAKSAEIISKEVSRNFKMIACDQPDKTRALQNLAKFCREIKTKIDQKKDYFYFDKGMTFTERHKRKHKTPSYQNLLDLLRDIKAGVWYRVFKSIGRFGAKIVNMKDPVTVSFNLEGRTYPSALELQQRQLGGSQKLCGSWGRY
jgi:hypothetical protein